MYLTFTIDRRINYLFYSRTQLKVHRISDKHLNDYSAHFYNSICQDVWYFYTYIYITSIYNIHNYIRTIYCVNVLYVWYIYIVLS